MNSGEVIRLDSANDALRLHFLQWQCRLRQILVREHEGRPDDSIVPSVKLADANEPLGHVITCLSRLPAYSKVPELKHLVRKTHDPAQRRSAALRLFSETYYQKAAEFSDVLTSTFKPDSEGAVLLRRAGRCQLSFDAFRQKYRLDCRVWRLSTHNPLWQATYWHNVIFNPNLPQDAVILGFEPDWSKCTADPMPL